MRHHQIKLCRAAAALSIALLAGCSTPPAVPPEVLDIQCEPRAVVIAQSKSLTRPLPLGTTPLRGSTRKIANSMLAGELQRGKPTESTEVPFEALKDLTLSLRAEEEPNLYAESTITVPPWKQTINLGLPARVNRSKKMGIEFAIRSADQISLPGYHLQIQDREIALPIKLDMLEGEYLFRLRSPSGQYFSGLLKLENADDEFVRFAYIPVFQKISPAELKEIQKREREPRMYTTSVDSRDTVLSTVWIGSRASTESVLMGNTQIQNIEVVFERGDARLRLNGIPVSNRFYVPEGPEHYLQIEVPVQDSMLTLYGVLQVPSIERIDTMLTSFAINITNEEIVQIIKDHQVIKKSGVYHAPENPNDKIQIYNLMLGQRKPRGMEAMEEERALTRKKIQDVSDPEDKAPNLPSR